MAPKTKQVSTAEQLRNEYRTALVGNIPDAKSVNIMFFGRELELREPPLDMILGKTFQGNIREQTVQFIINYTYIPGTDIQVFEEADKPQILKWPFGKDFMAMQTAIHELMGIDIEAEEAKLKADPLAEQS